MWTDVVNHVSGSYQPFALAELAQGFALQLPKAEFTPCSGFVPSDV